MGTIRDNLKRGISGAVVTVLLGWLLAFLPFGSGLVRWSFDVCQAFLPSHNFKDPVIIYMDEQAMNDYGQDSAPLWDRSLHARLVNRLSLDQPNVVVFDVTFTQPKDPSKDDKLAQAIEKSGRVVLAGDRVKIPGGYSIVPPLAAFTNHVAGWGLAKVYREADMVVRRYDPGDDQVAGLAWAAARVAGARATQEPSRRLTEKRWLNYYGMAQPFEILSMTYSNAVHKEPGFFRDRSVFIGGKPETLLNGELADVFGTPFTRWTSKFVPGVEITAIAFANLMHDDWLQRLGVIPELTLILVSGILLGWGIYFFRPWTAVWLSILVSVLFAVLVVTLITSSTQVWFCWAVLPAVQVPCALLFRFLRKPDERSASADNLEALTVLNAGSPALPQGGLAVSDHTLIRCIGEGAYGQVWVARNAIGLFHAVKVIHRNRFANETPYDRAFRGIQKFMPISRSHDGFVHVLHVGRNDELGFFYYIMEAADDQDTGPEIDPDRYVPKSLASELQRREKLPASECLELMMQLTEAVGQLHEEQLIHRDIKPANIIYVKKQPKLADIDLVTDLSQMKQVSCIGTEGYMPPEGPGTAAADVFSLGRILYVALTGKQPDQCPELPTRLADHMDSSEFMDLIQVSCKACETDVVRRYSTADRMREDLRKISEKKPE